MKKGLIRTIWQNIKERRGRPPVAIHTPDTRCDKCDLVFMNKREKRRHIDESHRI